MVENINWRSGPSHMMFGPQNPNNSHNHNRNNNNNPNIFNNQAQQDHHHQHHPHPHHQHNPYPNWGHGSGGGRGNQNYSQAQKPKGPTYPIASPPLHTLQLIQGLWNQSGPPKAAWFENPKGVLNNYCQLTMQSTPIYRVEKLSFPGFTQPIHRVTVQPDPNYPIHGVGDDLNKKTAQKLAAISACVQLGMNGAFDNVRGSNESDRHRLPDGTNLSIDQAKSFMDFYCQKFKFAKPSVVYDNMRKGKGRESWMATLSVEDCRIAQCQAKSKKESLNEAYLSGVVYLAQCDGTLWTEFSTGPLTKETSSAGTVPQVVFRLSNEMEYDLRTIVNSSRSSELYQRAKTMLESARGARKISLHPNQDGNFKRSAASARGSVSSEERLKIKSEELTNRLADYQTETSSHVVSLREQRASLPVTAHASHVLSALATNPVTILMAATGSGKTTQVPQLILDEATMRGQGARCNIICTQPRRIAAISVAQRVASERNEKLCESVGYQVRFEAKPPAPDGSILFCTTGVFLRRLQNDMESADGSFLDPITHIVVDEVHERDIDTDLLLFCLRRVLKDRKEKGKPEIKVLLMSATVDPTLFESYFADSRTGKPAPVISVPGRSFPVEKHYLEKINGELIKTQLPPSRGGWVWQDEKVQRYLHRELREELVLDPTTGKIFRDNDDLEMPYALISLVIAWILTKSTEGHVLVFLPGWEEIKGVQNILSNPRDYPLLDLDFNDPFKIEVHVLHSAIPVIDQQKVFTAPPAGVRRVILSTNIAETSVTIPDVVFVVDTGKIKEKRFDPERHLSSLVTAWVGTSNLNQRAGRAGRHRPGEYYGLLSARRHDALHIHSTVEMKRTDLSNLVMHVKALNFPNMEAEEVLAQTIEPPESERVSAAMFHLQTIGALDRYKDLTALGRVLLQLPVEAQIGKLLLLGSFFQCLEPALNLAAILTNRDPFLCPPTAKTEAARIKSSWAPVGFRSDPLACLAAFTAWSAHQDGGRDNYKAQRFATENFLSRATLGQISQVKAHLLSALRRAGVLAISGGGQDQEQRSYGNPGIPAQLNKNSDSLPLLAALIAVAVAPNFAVRKSTKIFLTEKDRTCFINLSSVNSHKKELAAGEDLLLQNERQLFAFGEKSLSLPRPGEKGQGQMTLRSTTRLDPLGYMLLGARKLQTSARGLLCDGWLPITGSEGALNDVEELKEVLDASLLRVFDGLQAQIFAKRDPAAYYRRLREVASNPKNGRSAKTANRQDEHDEDEDAISEIDANEDQEEDLSTIQFTTLTVNEIKDLEKLTEGVVSLLNHYAEERSAADQSRGPSRPDSRAGTRGAVGGGQGGGFSGGATGSNQSSRPGSSLAQRALGGGGGLGGSSVKERIGRPKTSVLSNLPPGAGMRSWSSNYASQNPSRSHTPSNNSNNQSRSSGKWR